MKTHPLSDEQASADQKSKPPSDKTHCQKRLLKHICKNNSGSKINCHSIMQYINTYFLIKCWALILLEETALEVRTDQ